MEEGPTAKEFSCFQPDMKPRGFQYQHWKDCFVSRSPERGASLWPLERNVLEMKWRYAFLSLLPDISTASLLSPKAGMEKRTLLILYAQCGVWRGQTEPVEQCPWHTQCSAWALGLMNTIHWVRPEREQSPLKSRQFLFKATLVFLPELLSSGLLPSNFFIACWETHLDWKEIQALASLVHAMQRGRGQSCAGEASWWEGKPCIVVFADLLGVNTPTLTGFKLLTWNDWKQSWEEMYTTGSREQVEASAACPW